MLLASAASTQVLTLEATRDNTLFEDAQGDTSNGSGPSLFTGRISQGRIRRTLVRFDVRSVLPIGASIDSVSLRLHVSSSSDPFARVLRVHRALANWGEGASASSGGSGAPAQPGDATWLHAFFPATFWISPGGDFAPSPSASTSVAGVGDYTWRDSRLTADVQAWLGAGEDNGWIVIGDETEPGTARRFDSREHPTPAQRPQLTVHYSITTRASPQSWGDLKIRYR